MDKETLKKCDTILLDLVEMANRSVDLAIKNGVFTSDLAESVGIVLTLAYGRFGE